MMDERFSAELRRLQMGLAADVLSGGVGTLGFTVACRGDSTQVDERVKEVLLLVDAESDGVWPSDEQWQTLLPQWFMSRCAPPRTRAEDEE